MNAPTELSEIKRTAAAARLKEIRARIVSFELVAGASEPLMMGSDRGASAKCRDQISATECARS